jgi:hypothetical protein
MNIVQQQAMLQRLPDQALIMEMKNPSGQVPQFLAMAELKRRQDERSMQAQQPPSTTTVADDLIKANVMQPRQPIGQSVTNEPGIFGARPIMDPSMMAGAVGQYPPRSLAGAALMSNAMERPVMYAGGMVRHYANGGGLAPAFSSLQDYLQQQRMQQLAAPRVGMRPISAGQYARNPQYGEPRLARGGKIHYADGDAVESDDIENPGDAAGLTSLSNSLWSGLRSVGHFFDPNAIDAPPPSPAAPPSPESVAAGQAGAVIGGPTGLSAPMPAPPQRGAQAGAASNNKATQPRQPTNQDGNSDFLSILRTLQENRGPDYFSGYAKQLQDYKDQLAAQRKQNAWQGLAAMGFGMAASPSPYFAQAVGQGGLAGLKEYSDLQKQQQTGELAQLGLGEKLGANEEAREQTRLGTAATMYDAQQRAKELGILYGQRGEYQQQMVQARLLGVQDNLFKQLNALALVPDSPQKQQQIAQINAQLQYVNKQIGIPTGPSGPAAATADPLGIRQ